MSQVPGGSSEPNISSVPFKRRSLRGVWETSILSSVSLSSFTCLLDVETLTGNHRMRLFQVGDRERLLELCDD